LVTLKTEELSA